MASLASMGGIQQHSPLWLDDGNIVLATASTAFKVHRGILERQSTVFKDLFSLPQSSPMQEFDGTPVIHMYDEPKDLEYFLLALYDGLHFQQRRATNFPILRGVLLLSIKYLVEHLRRECLKNLQHDWPTTLVAWDLREREAISPNGAYESARIRPHPIVVIKLAHELGPAGATLLPAAFYDLSRYNCSHIWMGCPNIVQDSSGITNTRSLGTIRLSMADMQTVMVGKETSQTFIAHFLREELENMDVPLFCEHGPYENGKACRHAFDDLVHEMYRGIVGVTCGRDSDPLFTLEAAMSMQGREAGRAVDMQPASGACEQCRAKFTQVALAARHYVWGQLPRWFGLEN